MMIASDTPRAQMMEALQRSRTARLRRRMTRYTDRLAAARHEAAQVDLAIALYIHDGSEDSARRGLQLRHNRNALLQEIATLRFQLDMLGARGEVQ